MNPKKTMETLARCNLLVSVGSGDGVLTTAAVLRNAESVNSVFFTQPSEVNQLTPKSWPRKSRVLFVDLAVNRNDMQMTASFLKRTRDAGHIIEGICDEHSRERWQRAFRRAGMNFEELELKPVTGKGGSLNSSGALLLSLLGSEADEHTRELCLAADAADRMNFDTYFGDMVNSCVKCRIHDNSRREYLARHFAKNREPDTKIINWLNDYRQILLALDEVIAKRRDLGHGFVRVSISNITMDVTRLISRLAEMGYEVVVFDYITHNRNTGRREKVVCYGFPPKLKDQFAFAFSKCGIPVRRFGQRVGIKPEYERLATNIAKSMLATMC